MQQTRVASQGFILIEALIAVVVVMVGMMGVAKLDALLLQGTGITKARAEAVQAGQARIEQMRNYDLAQVCSAMADPGPATVVGTNATFYVFTGLTDDDPTNLANLVEVCVGWGSDTISDMATCKTATQHILLNSKISCSGLGTSAKVGVLNPNVDYAKAPKIRSSKGRAVLGDGSTSNLSGTITDNLDGTRTHVKADGTRELVNATGKLLLYIPVLPTDAGGIAPAFSTIAGRLYVEDEIINLHELFAVSADGGYCFTTPSATGNWSDHPTRQIKSGSVIKYYYADYKCYLGEGWWGNTGVISLGASRAVCVGNPQTTATTSVFSKHPQASTSRAYRGFQQTATGWDSLGIAAGVTISGHHFVATENPLASVNCTTEETNLNTYTPVDTSLGSPLVGATNPGKRYCLRSLDTNGVATSCPEL